MATERTKFDLFPLSKREDKAATTTSLARSIIESEAAVRDAKTERLRQARLARDAAAAPAAPEPVKPARRRKRS